MIAIEKIITSLEENICLLVKHGQITDVALIHALEKEMATQSSDREPGGLRSMGSHRVGHD